MKKTKVFKISLVDHSGFKTFIASNEGTLRTKALSLPEQRLVVRADLVALVEQLDTKCRKGKGMRFANLLVGDIEYYVYSFHEDTEHLAASL